MSVVFLSRGMTVKITPKKKSKFFFSTDLDVSDHGESKSAIKKIARKNTPQATFQSQDFFFNHICIYIWNLTWQSTQDTQLSP
jgi:hypothetical protein